MLQRKEEKRKAEEEAIKWWRKSAAQGHVRAINKLKELGLGLE